MLSLVCILACVRCNVSFLRASRVWATFCRRIIDCATASGGDERSMAALRGDGPEVAGRGEVAGRDGVPGGLRGEFSRSR